MGKLSGAATLFFLFIFITALVQRNQFPERFTTSPQLEREPTQSPSTTTAITLNFSDVNYTVKPEYRYDIYGLVVSYRHHSGRRMLHKLWNDHLNMTDLCIVWGTNATQLNLNNLEFWNGQFSCNVKTDNEDTWRQFDLYKLSNNHLISGDNAIREKINGVKIGDRVHIQGELASYFANGQKLRGTSTTRNDTGNGACETIYVEGFTIEQRMSNIWRILFWPTLLGFILSLAVYVYSPPAQ